MWPAFDWCQKLEEKMVSFLFFKSFLMEVTADQTEANSFRFFFLRFRRVRSFQVCSLEPTESTPTAAARWLKTFLFFCLFVLMMWCECRCFGFLPPPPPRRDWMYNISRSLNIHDLPTLVWEKRQAKKRREKRSRNCRRLWGVCECDSLLSANSQKISLRCFSRHLVSVTKAGKKLGLWVR